MSTQSSNWPEYESPLGRPDCHSNLFFVDTSGEWSRSPLYSELNSACEILYGPLPQLADDLNPRTDDERDLIPFPPDITSSSEYENTDVEDDEDSGTLIPTSRQVSPDVEHAADSPSPDTKALASPTTSSASTVILSEEQMRVLEIVKTGRNIFFTGAAGTGKSVLLRAIIDHFRNLDYLTNDRLGITAPTGIAAINISGKTIHSFLGIGLGKESKKTLENRISGSKRLGDRWRNLVALIIDEISMLDGTLFDKLESLARAIRRKEQPFGGIQLILSGDFFQLPPVPDDGLPATLTFDADSWPSCVGTPVVLKRVFRQVDDDFIAMLTEIRVGRLSQAHINKWIQLERSIVYDDGIDPTQLFPLRAEVEAHNNRRLGQLNGFSYEYLAMDYRGYDHMRQIIPINKAKKLLEGLMAPKAITLKVGAKVMLIRNVSQGVLVNGSIGTIIEFLTTREGVQRNIKIAEIEQQNAEVHKDRANKNARQKLDERIRLAEAYLRVDPGVPLMPIDDTQFTLTQRWPLVRFENGEELLCSPLPFTKDGVLSNVEARRLQVPLILAWALSIHKSQGQTLTRVKVDFSHAFEKGQAYVALSRATTLECLEIANFVPDKIMAHPRVLAWHRSWMTDENMTSTATW